VFKVARWTIPWGWETPNPKNVPEKNTGYFALLRRRYTAFSRSSLSPPLLDPQLRAEPRNAELQNRPATKEPAKGKPRQMTNISWDMIVWSSRLLGIGSILVGFKIAGGEISLLWQPAEFIVIIGSIPYLGAQPPLTENVTILAANTRNGYWTHIGPAVT